VAQVNWRVYYVLFRVAAGLAKVFRRATLTLHDWAVDLEVLFSQAWADQE
jgi:hypothetical protein